MQPCGTPVFRTGWKHFVLFVFVLSSCFHHCQSSDTNKLNFQNRKNNWQHWHAGLGSHGCWPQWRGYCQIYARSHDVFHCARLTWNFPRVFSSTIDENSLCGPICLWSIHNPSTLTHSNSPPSPHPKRPHPPIFCYLFVTVCAPSSSSYSSLPSSVNNNATPIKNTDKKKFQRKLVGGAHSFICYTGWASSTTVACV